MIHLKAITYRAVAREGFPFSIPVIRSLTELTFTTPVTFLVGENGSGKSTLLEAIACAVGSITIGAESVATDPTLASIRELSNAMQLIWTKRTHRGFFMRSEDFFSFTRKISKMTDALEADLKRVDEEYSDRSAFSRGLARMAYATELASLNKSYGDGLDANSHGEAYFKLFQSRFVPGGLYLLDEPEAPLSPMRQLSFLAMLHEMEGQDAQFIIATHSPIIMAYPAATILSCDGETIATTEYETLEHVTITRSFLQNPDSYLKHLLGG